MIHQEPSSPPTRTSQLLLAAILAGGLFAASPTPPRSGASGTSPTEVAAMVAKAERLMAEGTWPQAARAWSKVETADPGLAEAAYNRGVAEYRSGELAAAADAFRRAAEVGDADLAAQAMYNEGTARYADAVKRLSTEGGESAPSPSPSPSPSGDPETPTDPLEDAMERVGRSLDHFRDAIDADPGNLDARANAELAHRLLQRLQEIQESSQDDQSQPGEESQDDQQQPGEESQDDQQQPGEQSPDDQQQPGEQSQDDQQQPGEQSQDDQQQPGEQSQDDQKQPGEQSQDDQQQPGEQSQDDQQQGGSAQDQPTEGGEAAEGSAAEDDKMSREEAERLLQSVRDKERQRRRARAEAESEIQDRRPPARKDW